TTVRPEPPSAVSQVAARTGHGASVRRSAPRGRGGADPVGRDAAASVSPGTHRSSRPAVEPAAPPPPVNVCVRPGRRPPPTCLGPNEGGVLTLHLLPGSDPAVTQGDVAVCWAVPAGQPVAQC